MQNIVFTSRLYYKEGVIKSLKKSIDISNIENALFWAYELYNSGFEDEIIHILCDYAAILLGEKSNFVIYAQKKQKEYKKKREPQLLITLIKNLISENIKKKMNKPESKRFLAVKLEEAEPYIKEPIIDKPPYRKLRHLCTCQIESIYLTNIEQHELLDTFRNDWLKYAAKSPIWKKRIENIGGIIQDSQPIFPDDEVYETFLQKYGYEPDEQGIDIYKKCLGIEVEKIQ